MMRSMFTAISSLYLHQLFMDVVADNLANTNTVGFKSSRVTFQNQFAQMLQAGSASADAIGGTNPAQVGLGTRLGSITASFSQGMLQNSGRNTDLAIQGDGFFIYSDGSGNFYSRDGALEIDSEGYLVNAGTGLRIQGWEASLNGGAWTVDSGGALDGIQLPISSTVAQATSNAIISGNLDSRGDRRFV